MKDPTIAVLWKHKLGCLPDTVAFVRRSGAFRLYHNVSVASIHRTSTVHHHDYMRNLPRRVRWEYDGEIDRMMAKTAAQAATAGEGGE